MRILQYNAAAAYNDNANDSHLRVQRPNCNDQQHHHHKQQQRQQQRRSQRKEIQIPDKQHKGFRIAVSQPDSSSFRRNRLSVHLLLGQMLLLLLHGVAPVQADWLVDCGNCHCKWNSGKKTADCKNLTLSAVPENLSSEVQVLDLSFNRITYMEENAFLRADLQNLHKLYIRNSSLQQIDPRTFTQLEILIELDLSNNLLRSLQANLFARLVKVRALVLNGNLLESLGDGVFQNLKYLHKVELKYNRLKRIGTQAFVNVPLLSQIYLDGNRLNFLRKESFESVKRLTALSLDQNPWNCTCELQIFRDFVLKRNLYTPPTACYYPTHLRGMLWVEDQPEAFACKPRIIYPARGASINTSKENVTLVCRVYASPNTHIAWDYNKQMYRANAAATGSSGTAHQQQQRVHIQLLRDEQSKEKEFGRDVFVSRLTILGAEKSDEGIYTCFAENAGGKDAVQMSLLVEKPGPRDLFLQGNLIYVICLMALGLLSVSVFLAMVTCCIYKRFKAANPGLHLHHPHVATQLTTTGLDHTTTTVTDGTDVVLGVSVDDVDTVNNFKHHLQKTNLNGGSGLSEKYAEALKHGVTVMDNGGVVSGVGHTAGTKLGHAEKAYLEQCNDDTLHIKYPHGLVRAEVSRMSTSANNSNKTDSKRYADMNGIIGETGGVTSEYQPDLLPAYNNKSNNNLSSQLYSPIKATKTIIPTEESPQDQHNSVTSHATKSKYNSSVQGYLEAKYGTLKTAAEKSIKREAPAIPLTTTVSLSANVYNGSSGPTQESGLSSTLQRHSRSVALPHRTLGTPTETSYEYRQPPPPPYSATHRTTGNLLMQRRTSINDDKENSNAKDLGYRDDKFIEAGDAGVPATRQTIVTASSSLNFLTTTEYTPRRQLL